MDSQNLHGVRQQVLKSTKWAMVSTFLPRFISPLTTVILARFLVPDDYGIVAISMIVLSLVSTFQDTGIGQALIQRQTDIESAKNSAFWLSIILAFVMSLCIFFLAPSISLFFHDVRVISVLRVQCWQVLISALGSIHLAIFRKDFEYKKIAGITVVPSLTPLFIAIPLAACGYGYWSLVIASMCAAAFQSALLWYYSPWRPSVSVDFQVAKEIFRFGILVTVEGLTAWFLSQGDNMVLGHFVSLEILGLYSYGYRLVMVFIAIFVTPFTSYVVYSAYCRLANQKDDLVRSIQQISQYLALVLFPVCFGIATTAHLAIPIVFGDHWQGLEVVIAILAISPGLSFLVSPLNDSFKAIGRPDVLPKFHIATIIVAVPIYIICAKHGLLAFCWGRFSIPLIFFLPKIIVASKFLNVPMMELLRPMKIPFISAGIMAATVWLFLNMVMTLGSPLTHLICGIILGAVIYIGCVYLFNRSLLFGFYSLGKRTVLG